MDDKAIKRRQMILQGNLWKAIILLAIPSAINDFIRATYNLVDTIFVAEIGSMEIAAVTFVGPLNMMVTTMSVGLSVAGTNLVAREIGRESYAKARNVAMQLLVVAASVGLGFSILSIYLSGQILKASSVTDWIFNTSNVYFRITALSYMFVFINAIYISVKRAEGDTLKAMKVNMAGMVVKIILTYILIFQLHMGVEALAVSTVIGIGVVTVYGLYDLFVPRNILRLSLKDVGFSWQFMAALAVIAIPVIIEKSSNSFSFIVLNKYVIAHGEKVLASYGITNRVNSMFFAVVTGFASGLSPIVSQNLSIGNAERARSAAQKTFIMATAIAVSVILIFLPQRAAIAGFFAKGDREILFHTVNAMSVYSISVIPWAWFQSANGVFQGTGHTKYNMIISILRIYLFRLPLVIYFTTFTDLGAYSIWNAMLISNLLTGACGIILYLYTKKDIRLVGETIKVCL